MPTAKSQLAALEWTRRHTTREGAVMISDNDAEPYPEVTGYMIPSLLECGERDMACLAGRWLIRVQDSSGGFPGADGNLQVFDTAQVLRGLLELDVMIPGTGDAIQRAAGWLASQVQPETGGWRLPDSPSWHGIPESVFLFAIDPLMRSLRRLDGTARVGLDLPRLIRYYARLPIPKTNSHFLGYVTCGLAEIGQAHKARTALRKRCTFTWPGLAQLAEAHLRVGQWDAARRNLAEMEAGQRASGGWTGGSRDYFEHTEIPWPVKFYLDSCASLRRCWFDMHADAIPVALAAGDERLEALIQATGDMSGRKVLDAGCGKGRYLVRLRSRFPGAELHGCDVSANLLAAVPPEVPTRIGSLTRLPYPDHAFDVVFCVESLEHAVFVPQAIREMSRVTKRGGTVVIIDKDEARAGSLETLEWEQWFPRDLLGIGKELRMADGLFRVWSLVVE